MTHGLVYTLRLLEPVLANSLAGDANSAQSMVFVPGGLVRGALIGIYLRRHGQSDAADEPFRRLFLSGQTRYLHAYPVRGDERGAPAPLAWKTPKHEGEKRRTAINLARREPDDDRALKGMRYAGWWKRGNSVQVAEIDHQVNVHTQRDAVFGRAREGQGAVFRYEALPAGLVLEGVILTESQQSMDELMALFLAKEGVPEPLEIWLGKGRTAGYGRVRIENLRELPSLWRDGWQRWETDRPSSMDDSEPDYLESVLPDSVSTFFLTFLSAGLVRDDGGQFTFDPSTALSARLNGIVRVKPIAREREIVGGFNRAWGLPLPQVGAIKAGSVFVVEADTPIAVAELNKIEQSGLGERRAEGFGRICIDVFQPSDISWTKEELDQPKPENSGTSAEWPQSSAEMAMLILEHLLRQSLDEKLLGEIDKWYVRYKPQDARIPNSQLSRWRTQVREVLSSGTPGEKLEKMTQFYFKEQKRRSYGWRAMERARVGRVRLTEWILEVLTDPQSPWKYLSEEHRAPSLALSNKAEFVATEDMRMEYKLRLIDGVLMATAKNAVQPARGGSHG